MKRFAVLAIGMVALNLNLNAALSPVYQSVTELEALLDSPYLIDALGQNEPIMNIERSEDRFIVTSRTKIVKVNIVYDAQTMPGPKKFHFTFLN